jgi:hypothetical protein
MNWRFISKAALLSLALGLLGLAVSGQPPAGGPAAVTSRDNFRDKAGKLKRLSAEELAKAVEEEEAAKRNGAKEAKEADDPPEPQLHELVPPQRLSRDALTLKSFAKAAASKKKAREFQITLRNATIAKYKNRATVTTQFQVVRSRSHSIKDDGDMHVAGLADEVMLACVAEIMNIRQFPLAAQLVRTAEKTQGTVGMTGAFRLWCEHPDSHGGGPQIQDDVIPDYVDSNPAHVFEIHPVSRINQIDLLGSFAPIPPAYAPKDAKKAFTLYESLPCRIVPDPERQTTTLFTHKVGFNYVKFNLRVDEDQHLVTFDTRIVRCSALSLDGEELVTDRRMVFVKNSPPEKAVRKLKKGDTLTVLGMPRIDLALVSWRARNAEARPEVLTWRLPYEMIVVGVYEE